MSFPTDCIALMKAVGHFGRFFSPKEGLRGLLHEFPAAVEGYAPGHRLISPRSFP